MDFDSVDHKVLKKSKLECYRIKGLTLDWFRSCLNDKKQAVKIGLSQSGFQIVVKNAPQGSVLGPLFLIYINHIHLSSSQVKFYLFADYTCILHSSKSISILEQELNNCLLKVSDWLKANKLTLNVDKSNLLLFKLNRNQNNENINISLGQDKLQPKEYAKYFGVFIDSKLT